MKPVMYRIRCITNLHVGSGDINYSIIDNEVEKDPVLGLPTIHASGVKGALRAHCRQRGDKAPEIEKIFGPEHQGKEDKQSGEKKNVPLAAGEFKFFSAQMLARPLRVTKGNNISYILTTTPEILRNMLQFAQDIGWQGKGLEILSTLHLDSKTFVSNVSGVSVEGISAKSMDVLTDNVADVKRLLHELLGTEDWALTDSFKPYDLPVVARNALGEDGSSKNIWYEEIVPHKSIFYFAVLVPDKEKTPLCFDEDVVHFGGNASVGYGYTRVNTICEGDCNE